MEEESLDKSKESSPEQPEDHLLIHGLSVSRYKEIYNSVLDPATLSQLSKCKQTEYICEVLELKRNLWRRLSGPELHEVVMDDGRVKVTEILDLR